MLYSEQVFSGFGIVFVVMVAGLAVPAFGQLALDDAGFDQVPYPDGAKGGIPAGQLGGGSVFFPPGDCSARRTCPKYPQ